MVKTTKYEDPGRLELIRQLESASKVNDSGLWSQVAQELSKVRKNRRQVNVYKIGKFSLEGDVIVIPGKVLGDGILNHKVDVAAYRFTDGAAKKIEKAGGKVMSIKQLLEINPKGSKIKLIG